VNARRVASRIYRLAIRAFPPHRRSVYGAEMIDAFERALDDRRVQGRARAALFVLAACLDAIRAGLEERRRSARRLVLASIANDLVHAGRSLLKARGFTFVCVASLGLGMGAVFALLGVTRVAIGAPPGVKTERLVELVVLPQDALRSQVGDWAIDTWTYPDFVDLLAADTGMSLAAWTTAESVVRLPDGTGLRVDSMYASPNYFAIVGAPVALGPGFSEADSAPPEVIVSTRFWQSRLAARPDVVGTTVVVGGAPHTIVGVAPEHFRGHLALHRPGFQLWLPLREHSLTNGPQSRRFDRSADWLRLLGRLSPGFSVAEANARVSSVMAGFAERYPASHRLKAAAVEPYAAVGHDGGSTQWPRRSRW
jgi:putative ABC transport system permease protein